MSSNQSSGRNIGMLAAGIAAGVIGSRLLPPLFAMANGALRARGGQDPFEPLIDDHRKIRSILDEMITAPIDSRFHRSRLFLMLKRKLAKHAMAEEDVVYPLLHSKAHDADHSKHLYDEHADMKILLFQLEELLKAGRDWRTEVGSLRDLILRHVDEEESSIFPRLRTVMTERKMSGVSGAIRREEALVL